MTPFPIRVEESPWKESGETVVKRYPVHRQQYQNPPFPMYDHTKTSQGPHAAANAPPDDLIEGLPNCTSQVEAGVEPVATPPPTELVSPAVIIDTSPRVSLVLICGCTFTSR